MRLGASGSLSASVCRRVCGPSAHCGFARQLCCFFSLPYLVVLYLTTPSGRPETSGVPSPSGGRDSVRDSHSGARRAPSGSADRSRRAASGCIILHIKPSRGRRHVRLHSRVRHHPARAQLGQRALAPPQYLRWMRCVSSFGTTSQVPYGQNERYWQSDTSSP